MVSHYAVRSNESDSSSEDEVRTESALFGAIFALFRPFWRNFIAQKRWFCQDRLNTHIGKTLKKESGAFFLAGAAAGGTVN
jgi:hypothetical protein|eukprot:COSAG06_NODE_1672_length_8747_cov_27.533418_8_plen_81_part_00